MLLHMDTHTHTHTHTILQRESISHMKDDLGMTQIVEGSYITTHHIKAS